MSLWNRHVIFEKNSIILVDYASELREKEGLALDEADFLRKHTSRAIKVPLPGPYMLTRSSWFEGLSDKVYESPENWPPTW